MLLCTCLVLFLWCYCVKKALLHHFVDIPNVRCTDCSRQAITCFNQALRNGCPLQASLLFTTECFIVAPTNTFKTQRNRLFSHFAHSLAAIFIPGVMFDLYLVTTWQFDIFKRIVALHVGINYIRFNFGWQPGYSVNPLVLLPKDYDNNLNCKKIPTVRIIQLHSLFTSTYKGN